MEFIVFFFFSSRRRHTRSYGDWSSDVCSSDLDEYREAPDDECVREQRLEIDGEEVGDEVAKHGVGGGEQPTEHDEQREGHDAAERRGARLTQPSSRELPPGHVVTDEREYTSPGTHRGIDAGPYVLPRVTPPQRDALHAHARHREHDDDTDRVEPVERGRVTGDEVRAEEQGRNREPGGVPADPDAMPTHEPRSGRDYPGGADEGVEAPRHGAQQHVLRDSRQGGCAQDVEAEPGLGAHRTHPAAASGRPPKRRSRARNSATAAASGAAPKSGHMVGVKYSSAYAHSHSRKSDRRCSPPVRIRRSTSGRRTPASIAQREE